MATVNNNLSLYSKEELPDVSHLKVALVVSNWNKEITENLYKGAVATFHENGVDAQNISRIDVPGSFELIFGSKYALQYTDADVVIAIGCVIQGQTKHFDYVCTGVSNGIAQLNIDYERPTIFCVLTDNEMQQSIDRSGGIHGNKGIEAAVTAMQMSKFIK